MNAQIELIEGTNRDLALSQYFTPPELAQKVVEWAGVHADCRCGDPDCALPRRPMRVLEPSAGNGALVRPLVAAGADVRAVELDERYCSELAELMWGRRGCTLACPTNFLEMQPDAACDLCVMNCPYEDGKDVAFILHALKFAPRVVGIFQAGIEYGVDRYDDLWAHVRPTRLLKLKRRWFKSADGKGGLTNYVVIELVKRESPLFTFPDHCTVEWW